MQSCMKKQKKLKKKIILGLTGSFGSGKSTVAGMFKHRGAVVIDADKLAHACICVGKSAYRKIVDFFGRGILSPDKTIDRLKLSQIVFNDPDKLKKLNSIVHPEVIGEIKREIKSTKEGLVVLDVPLLIEAGLGKLVDKIIVVKISRAQQLKRVKGRTLLSEADIIKRIKAQLSLSAKQKQADFVIDNCRTIKETEKQVERVWRSLVRILRSRDKIGHTIYVR